MSRGAAEGADIIESGGGMSVIWQCGLESVLSRGERTDNKKLCVFVCVDCFCSFSFGWHGFCGLIGKELLYRMLWIVSSSCWYSSASKSHVFSLL